MFFVQAINSDVHRIWIATPYYIFDEAVGAGIKVYRYQPGFMHQKIVLIDTQAAAVGSANLDNRSLRLNFEIMALIVDQGFASRIEAMLLDDFRNAKLIEHGDCERVPSMRRLGMQTARLFAPIF